MVITFMVGNGFDIGLGLHTQYINFYPYFTDVCGKNNMMKSQIEADKENGNYENWSDLEVAIGKFTTEISDDNQEEFINDKIEMEDLLIEYLRKERESVVLDDAKIEETIKNAIIEIWKGNNEKETELLTYVSNKFGPESHIYQAINFNYTDCFDYCFKVAGRKNGMISAHKNGGNSFSGEILHVHGTLEDKELLLGVNDENQVLNSDLRSVENIKRVLIKPYLNEKMGQKKTEKAKSMINNSNVICLYGVSIGDTDKMWWEQVGEWLLGNADRVLIIFIYNEGYKEKRVYRQIQEWERIKKQFLFKTNIPNEKMGKAMERIIVRIHENIFEIK